jgi:GPI ethanolamine phosphate transferase 2/3 subunit F
MSACLATAGSSFAVYGIITLLGAPLLRQMTFPFDRLLSLIFTHSHHLHTYLLACLISILTVFTPAYVLGLPSFASDSKLLLIRLTWTRLFAELSLVHPIQQLDTRKTDGPYNEVQKRQ